MKTALFALSALMLASGATGAFASPSCNGDFKSTGIASISSPQCEATK